MLNLSGLDLDLQRGGAARREEDADEIRMIGTGCMTAQWKGKGERCPLLKSGHTVRKNCGEWGAFKFRGANDNERDYTYLLIATLAVSHYHLRVDTVGYGVGHTPATYQASACTWYAQPKFGREQTGLSHTLWPQSCDAGLKMRQTK